MRRLVRHGEERATRPRERQSGAARAVELPEPALLGLQRSAGNRAVARLVADPARAPRLARALLLRDGASGGAAPAAVADVPLGQPPPVQVSPTDLAATVTPPSTVTYTGPGSGGTAPAPAQPAAPAPAPQAPAAAPAQAPAAPAQTTTTTTDDSHPHLDPMLTRDPYNVTLSYTIADLHAFRLRSRLADVDFLADPAASIAIGLDPAHAVAGQASVNVILAHIKRNGDSLLDLGFGPTATLSGDGLAAGAQATAELHLDERASLTFTASVTPTAAPGGGVDLQPSAVLGYARHF